MRYFLLSLVTLFFVKTSWAQKTKKKYQVGKISLVELKETTKLKSFEDIYNYYEPDSIVLQKIKKQLTNISFKLAYGEWCYDSKILVPKIIKILDCLKIPKKNVEIIGVNRKKDKPKKAIRKNKIKYVPTLLVLNNNVSIGKIEEVEINSLEKDLLKILQKK